MPDKGTLLIAVFLLSCASIAHTFLLHHQRDFVTRGSRLQRSVSRRTNSIRTLAVAAESLLENVNNQVSPATGKASKILWKDASPQRTVDKRQISWINQFPNTWQPAEKLLLGKDTMWHQGKATISTSGVEFRVASPVKIYDAGVVGTGPAALALASELAMRGLSVALIGPINAGFPNNYGVWMDEWEPLGFPEDCIEQVYATTRITITAGDSISIPRPYGKVSGQRCREVLLRRCAEHGVEVRESLVTRIEDGRGAPWDESSGGTGEEPAGLVCSDGEAVLCRVPVVAAGHYSPLVRYQSPGVDFMRGEGEYMTRDWAPLLETPPAHRIRISPEQVPSMPLTQLSWTDSVQRDSVRPGQHAWGWNWGWNPALRGFKVPSAVPLFGGCEPLGGGAPGYQIAYGVTLDCAQPHGYPLDEMLLMDFSTDHLVGDDALHGGLAGHVPTFLYAFAYDEKRVFLQETLLVARKYRATAQSLEMEEMVRRLERRVAHMGLEVLRRSEEEYSVIPMGGPLPVLGQPTVAYGAAAVMVHPASGYMINRAILQAPEVAAALAAGLRGAGGGRQQAAEAAWEAVWPKHRLIERDLYCFGMEVLLDLDVLLLQSFFRAFFADPKETMWRKFLAWDMTRPGEKPWGMSVFMILQFLRGTWPLKARLIREAMFKDGLHLLKSIFELPFPFD